jgi:NADPH:quinone reductase-like Zn-dependent oxidoreductase
MLAWRIEGAFGLDNLRKVELATPVPGPGEVVVRLAACSLNFRDLLMIRGHYNPRQPLPLIPGSDGVGLVESVGQGVSRVKVGDRVAGIFAQDWISGAPRRNRINRTLGGPIDGTFASHILLNAEGVVRVPDQLTDVEAATLPCAAVTAWHSLVTEAGIRAGDRVLILGTGGVSIFALQIARLFGAETYVTSSSDEKLEQARALGAHHTINYRTSPDWWREVRKLTGDQGVDVVVEVGGAGTFDASVRSVRVGGHVSLIGILAGGEQPMNLTRILMQNIRVQGILVGNRDMFEEMNRAIALHQLRPVIDRTFAFDEMSLALEHMAHGRHFGKVCVAM